MSSSGIYHDDAAPQNGLTIASTRKKPREKKKINHNDTFPQPMRQWERECMPIPSRKGKRNFEEFLLRHFLKRVGRWDWKRLAVKKGILLNRAASSPKTPLLWCIMVYGMQRLCFYKDFKNVNQSLHFSNHQKQQSSGYSLLGFHVLIYVVIDILLCLY